MIRFLSKSRTPSNLLSFHMKFILIAITGVCLWYNPDFRRFGADALQDASNLMRPEVNQIQVTF